MQATLSYLRRLRKSDLQKQSALLESLPPEIDEFRQLLSKAFKKVRQGPYDPIKYAEQLLSALPNASTFYDLDMLEKLELIQTIYMNASNDNVNYASGEDGFYIAELYQGIDTKMQSWVNQLKLGYRKYFLENDPTRSVFLAFLGIPQKFSAMDWLLYLLGGFLFSPLKNVTKLIFEYVPFIFEVTAAWAKDKCQGLSKTQRTLHAVLNGIYFSIKSVRQVDRTFTSPIRAFEERWKIHPLLGIASALGTVAMYAGVIAMAMPVAMALGVKLLSHPLITSVASFVQVVGSPLAHLVGAGHALSLGAGILGAVGSVFLGSMHFAMKGIASIAKGLRREKVSTASLSRDPPYDKGSSATVFSALGEVNCAQTCVPISPPVIGSEVNEDLKKDLSPDLNSKENDVVFRP